MWQHNTYIITNNFVCENPYRTKQRLWLETNFFEFCFFPGLHSPIFLSLPNNLRWRTFTAPPSSYKKPLNQSWRQKILAWSWSNSERSLSFPFLLNFKRGTRCILSQDSSYLALHESPWYLAVCQWALLTAWTINLKQNVKQNTVENDTNITK